MSNPIISIIMVMLDRLVSITISLIALIISIIALVYTAKTYLLKSGTSIRGTYNYCSSIECEDKYICNVTLENMKDRSTIIFNIYLKIGYSYYLEIDDFENTPLILKPFEVFTKQYDPIDFYSVSLKRIMLNNILEDNSVKKRIILSTSDGKYIVEEGIDRWYPFLTFFKNHFTAIIQPMRSIFRGRAYGSNAKFIIELRMENGNEEIIPIYSSDCERKKFKQFELTKESLESRESLKEYLNEKIIEGKLNCNNIEVYELDNWREEVYKMEGKQVIEASYEGWFMYYIVGRIVTIFSNYSLKRKNKALLKKRAKIK